MATGDLAVQSLRDALRVSPNNAPLRRHLAETLLNLGRSEEAGEEYRQALALAPEDQAIRLGLAESYYAQGKSSHALVLLEDLTKSADAPARAFVLLARLLAGEGDEARAASMYRRGVELDPEAADAELAARLIGESFSNDDEERVKAVWDETLSEGPAITPERPKVNFKDVGGMDAVKEEIRMKIIYPMTHSAMFKAYGKAVGGGILMYGPPGCGKTHLARATAGEINARFLAIGINDVLDMYIGNSERNLHQLFEEARRNKPCVLFFDEVDALGASRSDMLKSGARQLVNQFLAEMDGVQASNEGVLILAATNAPWHLDAAFRRPGRFDRILFVPPPDAAARAAILRILLRDKPVDRLDFDQIGKKAEEFSGADLKAAVDVAVEGKLREAFKVGKITPLTNKDLLAGAKLIKPSTKEWFSTARNYALYANQGGIYDDIIKYMKL